MREKKEEQKGRRKNREREEGREVLSGMETTYLKKIVFEILIYGFLYPSYGKEVACAGGPWLFFIPTVTPGVRLGWWQTLVFQGNNPVSVSSL